MDTVNLICSFVFLLLSLWALLDASRGKRGLRALVSGKKERPLSRGWAAALWSLTLLACLLRIYRFGSVPGGFNQDGAMAAVDALALLNHGTDRLGTRLPAHFTAWGYGQMSVLLSYCMVPLFRLFGMSSITARLPLLLWSFAGMAAAWVFLRELISPRAALIGLLFLGICPWHFMQSRWALDCNLFPHLFLLGFSLLFLGAGRPWALYVSMFFFALCMYSYGVAFLPVPLFLLGACLMLLRGGWIRPRQALICALLYLLLSFPIYGTMLINAMGWKTVELPFVTMPFFPLSVRSRDLIFFSPEPLSQLLENARALWNVGFLQGPDLPWNAINGFGTLYRCSWPLQLLGLGLAAARAFRARGARERLGYGLLLLFWLCALFTGLCVRKVNVNRINILFYAQALFLVIGTNAVLRQLRFSAWPLLAGCLLLSSLFFFTYFGSWARNVSGYFYEDFLAAVDCAGEQDFEVLVITPDVQSAGNRAVSEILTLYALQVDAEYYQGKTEDPLPYAERFLFRNLSEEDLAAPAENTCWVQRTDSLPPLLPAGWVSRSFGDYSILFYSGG